MFKVLSYCYPVKCIGSGRERSVACGSGSGSGSGIPEVTLLQQILHLGARGRVSGDLARDAISSVR